MNARQRLEADLERLSQMLPIWREKLREEAQFWPQFSALADEILAAVDPADMDYARRRIADMLATHRLGTDGQPLD